MAETEYQRLRREAEEARTGKERAGSPLRRRYSPEVRKARNAERTRRNQEARRRANLVLAHRYPEEFAALLAEELAAIDADKGPLPGDEP